MKLKEMQQGLLYRDGLYLSGGEIRRSNLPGNIASLIWSPVIHKCHQCGKYYILHENHEFYLELLTPRYKPTSIRFVKCKRCPSPTTDVEEYSIATSGNRRGMIRGLLDGGYLHI